MLQKRQAVINPENTFYSVKRFIGCKKEEIKRELQQSSYTIISDDNLNIKINQSGRFWNANTEYIDKNIEIEPGINLIFTKSEFIRSY